MVLGCHMSGMMDRSIGIVLKSMMSVLRGHIRKMVDLSVGLIIRCLITWGMMLISWLLLLGCHICWLMSRLIDRSRKLIFWFFMNMGWSLGLILRSLIG